VKKSKRKKRPIVMPEPVRVEPPALEKVPEGGIWFSKGEFLIDEQAPTQDLDVDPACFNINKKEAKLIKLETKKKRQAEKKKKSQIVWNEEPPVRAWHVDNNNNNNSNNHANNDHDTSVQNTTSNSVDGRTPYEMGYGTQFQDIIEQQYIPQTQNNPADELAEALLFEKFSIVL